MLMLGVVRYNDRPRDTRCDCRRRDRGNGAALAGQQRRSRALLRRRHQVLGAGDDIRNQPAAEDRQGDTRHQRQQGVVSRYPRLLDLRTTQSAATGMQGQLQR